MEAVKNIYSRLAWQGLYDCELMVYSFCAQLQNTASLNSRTTSKVSVRCFKQIWKVGKVGKVGEVGEVGEVGKVGKVGREGLIMPIWNQL